jgi:hypothetical protein
MILVVDDIDAAYMHARQGGSAPDEASFACGS